LTLPRYRSALATVLLVAFGLRLAIALGGGEHYWPDESRFGDSRSAAARLLAGDWRGAGDAVLTTSDHLLFRVIGILPALLERAAGNALWVSAACFGLASVAVIYLLSRLILEQGGTRAEALGGAVLAAAADFLFYYARHNVPYDLALAFITYGLLRGLRPGLRNGFWAGTSVGLGFMAYNGYWAFGGVALVLSVLNRRWPWVALFQRAAVAALGFVWPVALVVVCGRALHHDLIRSYIQFSREVNAGNFGVGWRFIPEYFWASEHGLVLLWGAGTLAAMVALACGRLPRRAALWLAGAALLAGGMILLSDVFPRFEIHARHARPLGLFLVLLTAWWVGGLRARGRWGMLAANAILAGAVLQGAWNFAVPLRQMFPPEFATAAEAAIRWAYLRSAGPYRILNGQFFANPVFIAPDDYPMEVIYRVPHPHEFEPYLYEGYTDEQRAVFRSRDLSMRVVRLLPEQPEAGAGISREAAPWAPYPGAVAIGVRFTPERATPTEPLLSAGVAGAGDGLFVRYEGPRTLRLGFDHWGSRLRLSAPIDFDPAKPHVVTVSVGFLYPPARAAVFKTHPEWARLRHLGWVALDGMPVLGWEGDCYPAAAESIELLNNFVGLGTTGRFFSGHYLFARSVPPDEIIRLVGRTRPDKER